METAKERADYKYYWTHRDLVSAKNTATYFANHKRYREVSNRFYANNREKILEYKHSKHINPAKREKPIFSISHEPCVVSFN